MNQLHPTLPDLRLAIVMGFAVFLAGTMLVSVVEMFETRAARLGLLAVLLMISVGSACCILTGRP